MSSSFWHNEWKRKKENYRSLSLFQYVGGPEEEINKICAHRKGCKRSRGNENIYTPSKLIRKQRPVEFWFLFCFLLLLLFVVCLWLCFFEPWRSFFSWLVDWTDFCSTSIAKGFTLGSMTVWVACVSSKTLDLEADDILTLGDDDVNEGKSGPSLFHLKCSLGWTETSQAPRQRCGHWAKKRRSGSLLCVRLINYRAVRVWMRPSVAPNFYGLCQVG